MHNISDNWEPVNSLLQTFEYKSTNIYQKKKKILIKIEEKTLFFHWDLWEPRKIPVLHAIWVYMKDSSHSLVVGCQYEIAL